MSGTEFYRRCWHRLLRSSVPPQLLVDVEVLPEVLT